jgi:hypothetical protein
MLPLFQLLTLSYYCYYFKIITLFSFKNKRNIKKKRKKSFKVIKNIFTLLKNHIKNQIIIQHYENIINFILFSSFFFINNVFVLFCCILSQYNVKVISGVYKCLNVNKRKWF